MAEHLAGVLPRTEGWALNGEQLARLCEMIADCLAAGIRFTVVLPPASPEVHEYVIGSLGIAPLMAPALQALRASGAAVLDYEFALTGTLSETQFYDGFHLDLERGLGPWTQQLFSAVKEGRDGA
jgi:hypothetical protein